MLPIHFAPLQGYTEDAYRRLHHDMFGGVACYYTPFVRVEHKEIRSKDLRDIRREYNAGVPVVPQAIAANANELKMIVEAVRQNGYGRMDINMGCPFPLQTRHGRGAGLLPHADMVAELCEVVKQTSDIRFSVKMRLGLDDASEWEHIMPILNDTPLEHITMHPRIASQQYKGAVDMDAFERFLAASQHPVIYNGDIASTEDIMGIEQTYPTLAGVMIGRGLLARPSLATEYVSGIALSDSELIGKVKHMHSCLLEHYTNIIPGETQRLNKIRTFWDYLEHTIDRRKWKRITKAGNMKNYLAAIQDV